MNETKLGTVPSSDDLRDAVHVAIIPMLATKRLKPGEWVDDIGIVDPWLEKDVKKGEWFWLCLRPGSITSLRHDWEHPRFTSGPVPIRTDDEKAMAKKAIGDIAEKIGHPFETADELIAHVESCMAGGGHYTEHGHEWMRGAWYEKEDEFWKHYETLTGKKKPEEYMPVFCCSC